MTSATQRYVTTVVSVSGSSTFTSVYTTEAVVASTTGYATATVSPSLNNGGGSGSSSGLSTKSKQIIGGVIGGVGGAILVGGIALVAWRMWGRRRHDRVANDEDALDSPSDSLRREKAARNGTPFQRNLDQYHNPGGVVNTASNF